MRRLPSTTPTWKSHGLHKTCPCPKDMKSHLHSVHEGKKPFKCDICDTCLSNARDLKKHIDSVHEGEKPVRVNSSTFSNIYASCGCIKTHYESVIDNAYISIAESASLQVLDVAITDHFPILVNWTRNNSKSKVKLKTIYRRDITRVLASDLEAALEMTDWSPIFDIKDPNEAVDFLFNNVKKALDIVAPMKPINFRPDKPKISLRRDTLATMDARDKARKFGNKHL